MFKVGIPVSRVDDDKFSRKNKALGIFDQSTPKSNYSTQPSPVDEVVGLTLDEGYPLYGNLTQLTAGSIGTANRIMSTVLSSGLAVV